MPRSRSPRRRLSDKETEQARLAAIEAAAKRRFERRTLHLFILSLAAFPLALLSMRSAVRHSHISFCAGRQLAPWLSTAILLLSAYLIAALVATLVDVGRGPHGQIRDELMLLIAVLVAGAATYAWLGTNVLKSGCLA